MCQRSLCACCSRVSTNSPSCSSRTCRSACPRNAVHHRRPSFRQNLGHRRPSPCQSRLLRRCSSFHPAPCPSFPRCSSSRRNPYRSSRRNPYRSSPRCSSSRRNPSFHQSSRRPHCRQRRRHSLFRHRPCPSCPRNLHPCPGLRRSRIHPSALAHRPRLRRRARIPRCRCYSRCRRTTTRSQRSSPPKQPGGISSLKSTRAPAQTETERCGNSGACDPGHPTTATGLWGAGGAGNACRACDPFSGGSRPENSGTPPWKTLASPRTVQILIVTAHAASRW
jgi:hypothetical protein